MPPECVWPMRGGSACMARGASICTARVTRSVGEPPDAALSSLGGLPVVRPPPGQRNRPPALALHVPMAGDRGLATRPSRRRTLRWPAMRGHLCMCHLVPPSGLHPGVALPFCVHNSHTVPPPTRPALAPVCKTRASASAVGLPERLIPGLAAHTLEPGSSGPFIQATTWHALWRTSPPRTMRNSTCEAIQRTTFICVLYAQMARH